MIDFDFKRSSRRCHVTGREFNPGETYISAVFQIDEGVLERRDYGIDQWTEPPEDCVGWWRCTVPLPEEGKIYWAPRRVLISYFESLFDQPELEDLLYVTALVLVQRKVLKLVLSERNESGVEQMIVIDTRSKKEYQVPVVDVAGPRVSEIQAELSQKLFTDRLDEYDDDMVDDLETDDARDTDLNPDSGESSDVGDPTDQRDPGDEPSMEAPDDLAESLANEESEE